MKSGKNIFKLSRSQWISVAVLASSLGLAVAAVTVPNPSFTAGNPISSTQVNANFAALANAMPAVKEASLPGTFTITATTAGAAQDVLSLSATPPANGFIILTGSGLTEVVGTVVADNYMYIDLTTTSGGSAATAGPWFWAQNIGHTLSSHLHVQSVFPVTGGTPYTFYMTAQRDPSGSNSMVVGVPRLIALFVPGTALP